MLIRLGVEKKKKKKRECAYPSVFLFLPLSIHTLFAKKSGHGLDCIGSFDMFRHREGSRACHVMIDLLQILTYFTA